MAVCETLDGSGEHCGHILKVNRDSWFFFFAAFVHEGIYCHEKENFIFFDEGQVAVLYLCEKSQFPDYVANPHHKIRYNLI